MYTSLRLLCLLLQLLLHHTGASDSGIIGGQRAKPHSRPYMASLQIDGSHLCGGFLIRKDFILTSAHCSHRCKEIKVVLGAHNIRRKEALIQKIPVKKCYKHNLYKIAIYDYDIMLIKLQHNAALNKNVKVIELPKYKETVPDETQCTMSGWGKTTPQGQFESVLQEVSLKIQSNKECRTAWHNVFSPQRTLCTHFNGKKGICQGDSGGPLVCKNKAHGIAAFTGNPCNMNYPNVFMKVSFFIPWIKDTMQE
ncbi:granzyme B-like [Scleropages formosus]|uniref:Granzyme B-like n=1 Tax=Scleropages formosus TaxID=113540 RepID=A0A8C9V3I6_SCLFO|nr:granzyme B-like [Scleropages formosus]